MVTPPPIPEPDWVAHLEQLTPRLHAWAGLRLRGESQASREDFVQEVLCRAIAGRERFVGDDPRPWVFQIARHLLLESLRNRRRLGRFAIVDGRTSRMQALQGAAEQVTSVSQRVARSDEFRQLMASVDGLDEIERHLVVLCGLEGETTKAASVQVGLGEEACAKRWYRLRQRLRAELGGEQT